MSVFIVVKTGMADIETGSTASRRREKLEARLIELQEDRKSVRSAIRNILEGKAQSYGVGTRNKSAYNMSLSELRFYLKEIEDKISEVENQLNGGGPRLMLSFVPID